MFLLIFYKNKWLFSIKLVLPHYLLIIIEIYHICSYSRVFFTENSLIISIITSGPAPAPGKINDILFFVDNKTKLVYKLGSKMISFFYSLI